MSDAISWVLMLSVKDGKLDEFTALMGEMVEATKNEEGAEIYEWYVSDDGSVVHIFERYADSAATMVHMGNFGANYADRFFSCVDPTGFHVYGNSNDEVKGALGAAGAQFYAHLGQGGFAR